MPHPSFTHRENRIYRRTTTDSLLGELLGCIKVSEGTRGSRGSPRRPRTSDTKEVERFVGLGVQLLSSIVRLFLK
nr:unnamed protein product [Spirometra erinaceieuropaei]